MKSCKRVLIAAIVAGLVLPFDAAHAGGQDQNYGSNYQANYQSQYSAPYSYNSYNNNSYPQNQYPQQTQAYPYGQSYGSGYQQYPTYPQYPQQTYTPSPISFSQNNIILAGGQSITVMISGGSGSYYEYSNSNPNIVQTAFVGGQLTINALYNSSGGSSGVTVCSPGPTVVCGTLTVTINPVANTLPVYYPNPPYYSYPYQSSGISFSQNNLSLASGQNQSIGITGNGGYYISYNSNPTVATASINGNTLIVYAGTNGSTNITICQNTTPCGTLYVTVGNTNNNNGYSVNTNYGENKRHCK